MERRTSWPWDTVRKGAAVREGVKTRARDRWEGGLKPPTEIDFVGKTPSDEEPHAEMMS
jgi:hypothetical protein